jgi:hypothetical protein
VTGAVGHRDLVLDQSMIMADRLHSRADGWVMRPLGRWEPGSFPPLGAQAVQDDEQAGF